MSRTYRVLEPEEYRRLEFIFKPRGYPLPNPNLERAAIVEEGEKIISTVMLRILPLMDGLWVAPHHRGGDIDYGMLASVLEKPFHDLPGSRCYALGLGTFTKNILHKAGFDELEGSIFEKRY